MASYSDSAKPLAVYLDWECKDANGDPIGTSERKKLFTAWVTRMMKKTALMDQTEADDWVRDVITPNGLTSVHELAVAANIKYTERLSWITTFVAGGPGDPMHKKLRLRDQSLLNDLMYLAEAELKTLGTGSSSRSVANNESTGTQNLMLAMAFMNQRGNASGLDVTMFPGLSQQVAETKRVRREQLKNLVKSVKLDDLYDELLPGDKVMKAVDASLAGGNEHVAVSINDLVELFDEWCPQSDLSLGGDGDDGPTNGKPKPPKGEAFGVVHHLLKLLTFMIALRLRGQIDECHVYNMLYFVMKSYRNEGNKEVGMHYAQSLLDRLHKKSWWKSQGSLKDALKEPNKEVLESLRTQYPRQAKGGPPPPKGGGRGKVVEKVKPGKGEWQPSWRGRGDDWTPQRQGQRREPSDRSRSRSVRRKRDGGKDGGKGKDGGRGGTGKGSIDPRVRRIFSLCKDKKEGKCPYYQSGTCQFSKDRCKLGDHKCFLCGGSHAAVDCNKLSWDETKKKLGMS